MKTFVHQRFSPGEQRGRDWKMIAKGNPNWPQVTFDPFTLNNIVHLLIVEDSKRILQAFYPMNTELVVNPGDILAAR